MLPLLLHRQVTELEGSVVALNGYNLMGPPFRHPHFRYFIKPMEVLAVDIIAGFRGVLYPAGLMNATELILGYQNVPSGARWVDDDYLSGQAARRNITRFVVPSTPDSCYWNIRGASTETNALSGGNNKKLNIDRQAKVIKRFVDLGYLGRRGHQETEVAQWYVIVLIVVFILQCGFWGAILQLSNRRPVAQ